MKRKSPDIERSTKVLMPPFDVDVQPRSKRLKVNSLCAADSRQQLVYDWIDGASNASAPEDDRPCIYNEDEDEDDGFVPVGALHLANMSDAASHAGSSSSRPRSQSPTRLNPQPYRAKVLDRLNIQVDVRVPRAARDRLRPEPPTHFHRDKVQSIARRLHDGAVSLSDQRTANEAAWAKLLGQAIDAVMGEMPGRLYCVANMG